IISACYFALLHTCFSFFGELGGFQGLFYLGNSYVTAVSLSFTALIMLCIVTVASIGFFAQKLPPGLRDNISILLYGTGLLVVIHSLMLGGDFVNISTSIPQMMFSALAVLVLLLAYQCDVFFKRKYTSSPQFGITIIIVVNILVSGFIF